MPVPRQLDEAVARLERASLDLEAATTRATTLENLHAWLEALTQHSLAMADVQRFGNESIHEKLHAIAGRLGIPEAATPGGPPRRPPPD